MSKVLVVGGGAAGMFAAIFAAYNGNEVHIFEKNEKLGKKLFITGKGRCNITNSSDMETLFNSIVTNSKFLYSSFYGYTNQDVIEFFERIGVKTKIERGNRVFPVSDHSSDVIVGLTRELQQLGVEIHLHTAVKRIVGKERFEYLELQNGTRVEGDACIVATGGFSYQTTGSTGDGYRFAKELGHQVTEILPALVPLTIKEWYAKELQGLSLRNVQASVYDDKKKIAVIDRMKKDSFFNKLRLKKQLLLPGISEEAEIGILVDTMGRVNYGIRLKDYKGLVGDICIHDLRYNMYTRLMNITTYSLPLDTFPNCYNSAPAINEPAFYKYELTIDKPQDTVMHLEGFTRGFAFINGFNLGRHWDAPLSENKLFIPAPLLKEGENEIIVFDFLHKDEEKKLIFGENK